MSVLPQVHFDAVSVTSGVAQFVCFHGKTFVFLSNTFVVATWLSSTLPLFSGGNCLESGAVVPVKFFWGGLNCKPLLGSVVTESACVVIMVQGCYPFG